MTRFDKKKHQEELRKQGKSTKGFASMDPKMQALIASKGGLAAHKKGTAHTWTSEEARRAGEKGGRVKKEQYKTNDTRS